MHIKVLPGAFLYALLFIIYNKYKKMTFQEIAKNVIAVRTDDAERKLFDQLVPLPEGTSYNSYIIKGQKAVMLVDSTYTPKADEFIAYLKQNGVDKLDYIVANHGEEDHTGALPKMLETYTSAKVLTNAKCAEIIKDALHIPSEKIEIFADNQCYDLGGKTVKFMLAPWVHWPDTSFAYLQEDNILFSTDFFGAHIATSNVFSPDDGATAIAAKRYYAEIMQPFANFCLKYCGVVRKLNPSIIAPSHGLIYKNPEFIISLYEKWANPVPEKKVVVAYVSMYGHVEEMCKVLNQALVEEGVETELIDIAEKDIGEFAMSLIGASALVVGASMVLAGPHPVAVSACYVANLLRPKIKYLSVIGSFAWGGILQKKIEDLFATTKPERLPDVLVKGSATPEQMQQVKELAKTIAEKLRQ